MSNTIDTNVVQLKFDNKQFEEGCKESMSTLEKLKQKINESSSGNALNELNKTDLSGLEKSISKINSHFSLLGIAALKVKSSIVDGFLGMAKTLATTVPSIIKEGGWTRAMNIEEAKFQLEGLGVAWKDISDDISYAVDGTAYGLDAAAKAASQLVASGVGVGDSMKNALRAISGVAAMTNSEYEAIAPIFTTVAGQGKLMTMQLRQLENRGLNAAAVLAESMGTTEAAVRDMVTKGQIDFQTFAEAMDSAFGEHAKDANRTFTGVTANIRAALKKIGADFATPIIEQDGPVVVALQKLRERINDVRASLGPLTDAWTSFVRHYGTVAANLLESIDMSFMEHVVAGLVNLFKALLTVIRPIGYAFKDVFAPEAANTVMSISEAFERLTSKLVLSDKAMEGLRATVRGVLSIFKIFTTIIKQVLGALMGIKPETVNIGETLLTITGTIGNVITYISMIIKQVDIIGPAIKGVGNVLKLLIGVLGLAVSKIIEFIRYISKLEITRNIINGLTIVVKLLAAGIGLLVISIKNLITGGIQALPSVLTSVANGFKEIFNWLGNIPLINSAVEAIKKLVDAIANLINPKIKDDNGLKETVTIVDEAVALAGPPQVKKISTLEKAITALGNAVIFVKNGLVAVFTPIKNFVQFLGAGGIAALAFTVAIGAIGVKLTKTMESVTKTFNATAGVLKTLGSDGVMGLIFGKKQQIKIPFLIQLSVAIATLAASFKLLSRIPSNKLKEVGIAMAGIAGGLLVLMTAMTIAQKVLGKGETLALANVMITIAGAVGIMAASLIGLNNLLSGGFVAIQSSVLVLLEISAIIGTLSIVLAKLAPELSTGALSLIAMAVSIRILIGALDKLSDISVQLNRNAEDYDGIWGKTGYLMVVAGGLVIISGIASKLGTNSLLGIMVALLSLKAIIPLANSIAEAIKTSVFADAWIKLRDFFVGLPEGWKKGLAGIAATVVIIGVIVLAVVAFKKLVAAIKSIGSSLTKVGTETSKWSGISKALSRLSLVPVIVALTGMMVAIGAMVAILGNIKIANLNQAVTIMVVVGAMFLTLAVVVAASKDAKPAAVIAGMIGLTMMFSELIVLSLLIEQHYVGVLGACVVMAIVMHELANVFDAVSEASEVSGKTLVAVGMIAGIIAELGGLIYILSQQDWKGVAASGVAMYLALKGVTNMLSELGEQGQSFGKEKMKILAETIALLPIVGASLAIATLTHDWSAMLVAGVAMGLVLKSMGSLLSDLGERGQSFGKEKITALLACSVALVPIGAALALATLTHDWKSMLAAGASMSLVMVVFGAMMQLIGKTKWDAGAWSAIGGIAISAVAIGAALALATLSHDWQSILAAAGAMSLVMGVFGGMAILLGKMNPAQAAASFAILLGISITSVAIGASLALLAQYPWQQILAAAGIMVGTATLLGIVAAILGAPVIGEMALLGAGILDLLAAGFAAMAISSAMLLSALTAFLPVADAFISGVLGTLVSYSEQLPAVGTGLLQLALGLAATGAAGIVIGLGAAGLLAAAVGLTALVPACKDLSGIDLIPLAEGLAALVIPGLAMALVGPAMTIGAVGIALFTAALAALAVVLRSISAVITPAIKAIDDLGKRVQKAKTWGADMIDNFIGGIKQKFTNLKNAVVGIADLIRSYLHFSTPDIGSLADADTWMPDMMDMLGEGILSELPSLDDICNNVADVMSGDFDIADVMEKLGMSDAQGFIQGFMDGFESMGSMHWFGDLGVAKADSAKNANDMKKEQIALRKANAKAAKEETINIDDYITSVGKAGGASSKAAEEVKDLSEAFKTLDKGSKVNLGNLMNTLVENTQATARWAKDMKALMSKGYDSAITDWVRKMGVGGHETVKALLNGTESEVAGMNAALKSYLTLDKNAEAYILGKYDKLGELIMQVTSETIFTYSSKLAETIQSAINPFSEFNKKTELTSDKMLANMRSQITGITEWSDNITSLIGRVPDEIIEYFQDLGPASYEEVNAMAHMTEGQLAEAVDLWTQQLELGKALAIQQAQKYREVGLAITDGLSDGVDLTAVDATGTAIGDSVLNATKTKLGVHSPSTEYFAIGKFLPQGLGLGVKQNTFLATLALIAMAQQCKKVTYQILNEEAGEEIGMFFMRGLSRGIINGESSVIEDLKSMARRVIEAAHAAFDEHSPSRIFETIGINLDRGLGQGINKGTNVVLSATQNMADNTIQMMNSIIKNISAEVNDSPEFQPVIRPRLDLTELQNGKSYMNSMFDNPAYQMATSIASNMVASTVNPTDGIAHAPSSNQTIIFNQTNNSPKNIDPYESYRLNRLAAEQLKGAFR